MRRMQMPGVNLFGFEEEVERAKAVRCEYDELRELHATMFEEARKSSGATGDGELHAYAGTSAWLSGFFPSRRIDIFHSYATISSSVNYRPLLIATYNPEEAELRYGDLIDYFTEVGNPSETEVNAKAACSRHSYVCLVELPSNET